MIKVPYLVSGMSYRVRWIEKIHSIPGQIISNYIIYRKRNPLMKLYSKIHRKRFRLDLSLEVNWSHLP